MIESTGLLIAQLIASERSFACDAVLSGSLIRKGKAGDFAAA